jgi:S-(hydroxymethyl)glutathione dehydrogenase / alcohol dehydrogenase
LRAAVMREFRGDLTIEDVEIDTPRTDEVLIRTVASGICHTDLTYWGGRHPHPLPMILGHEGCGIVEAIGPGVTNVAVGDAVVTCMTSFCGHCDHCVTGNLVLCESAERDRPADAPPKVTLGGAKIHPYGRLGTFAEKMLVYKNSCVRIRPDVPLDKASVVGCGVLTGVGAVINTAKVQPGQSVAVLGCGGVGLSAINGAVIASAGRIIAVDTQKEKLELARAFGATDCVDASSGNAAQQVMEMTKGGVDVAFEAVGTPQTAQTAFGMIRRGGAMILVGMLPPDEMVSFPGKEFVYGKKVIGSMLGSNRFPHDIPKLIEFYMQGKLKLDELVSQRIALDDVNEALHQVGKGGVARSVIVFE